MPITRRRFICQMLAVGPVAMAFWTKTDLAWAAECGLPAPDAECTLPPPGEAQRFIPNEPKVQTRYSALEMADPSRATQIKQFRDAICEVRDRHGVRSWTKQIAQHCIHCARGNPRNIHFDWQFLPWHRGLLYFLERILRKLGGNDDLRLVYWDWENPLSRTLPAIYAPPDQPLYWKNRNFSNQNLWPLRDNRVNVQPLLGLPAFRVFGGTAVQGSPTPASFGGPHANVHNAFAPGDMADLQFSPRDPVFYAHHGNIDRLWSSWVAAGHSNPDFGDARVFFYDENRQWRYVLMNDLRDESKLGYKYSSLMQPRVPIASLKASSLERTANRVMLAAPALESVKAGGPEFLIIENLRDLEKLPADAVEFGIFHGSPDVGTPSATAPGFLGTASRVLSAGHAHEASLSAALDVTDKLGPIAEQQKGTLELTVAPLDTTGKTTALAIPLVADAVSVVS